MAPSRHGPTSLPAAPLCCAAVLCTQFVVLFAKRARLDHGDVLDPVERGVRVDGELAELGGQPRDRGALHERLALAAVADEVGDEQQRQPVRARERLQRRLPRHAAVVVHQLAQHAHRRAPAAANAARACVLHTEIAVRKWVCGTGGGGGSVPGEAGEVDGRLRVAGAAQHAALRGGFRPPA